MMSEKYHVSVGDHEVAIRRHGRSDVVTAKILGREKDALDRDVLYLDRRVHTAREDEFDKWSAAGAFVTVLTQK